MFSKNVPDLQDVESLGLPRHPAVVPSIDWLLGWLIDPEPGRPGCSAEIAGGRAPQRRD